MALHPGDNKLAAARRNFAGRWRVVPQGTATVVCSQIQPGFTEPNYTLFGRDSERQDLIDALAIIRKETKDSRWIHFAGQPVGTSPVIQEEIVQWDGRELIYDEPCNVFHFDLSSWSCSEQERSPAEGLRYRSLAPGDVPIVNRAWAYNRKKRTWPYFEVVVERCPNLALVDQDDRLCAWVVTHHDGTLGHFFVVEEQRRRGHGKRLINAFLTKLQDEGFTEICCHIVKKNDASRALFEGMGFAKVDEATWMGFARRQDLEDEHSSASDDDEDDDASDASEPGDQDVKK